MRLLALCKTLILTVGDAGAPIPKPPAAATDTIAPSLLAVPVSRDSTAEGGTPLAASPVATLAAAPSMSASLPISASEPEAHSVGPAAAEAGLAHVVVADDTDIIFHAKILTQHSNSRQLESIVESEYD